MVSSHFKTLFYLGNFYSLELTVPVPDGQLDALQQVAVLQLEDEPVVEEGPIRVTMNSRPLETRLRTGHKVWQTASTAVDQQ